MKSPTYTVYSITVILSPQSEGGYTVTCEELPELVTEVNSRDEALNNVVDAFIATLELYEDLGRQLPDTIIRSSHEANPATKKTTTFKKIRPKVALQNDNPPYYYQAKVPHPTRQYLQ